MNHPKNNQIQLTVFGPGYGESILIHFGDRCWGIVDSCLNDEKKPAALSYLKSIGVDVSTEVKIIVATHWHDDHVKGLNDTLRECSSAQFALPLILNKDEFVAYMKVHEKQPVTKLQLGVSEMLSCLKTLEESEIKAKYVIQERNIWEQHGDSFSHKNNVRLMALSPSDRQFEDFLSQIGRFINFQVDGENIYHFSKPRLIDLDKNKLSTAILLTIGEFSILLGSDVIVTQNSDSGWKKIINLRKGEPLKSQIYKVAHHGSEIACFEEVYDMIWNELLTKNPVSIVTPWTKGGNRIPSNTDIQRIKRRSDITYITSDQPSTNSNIFKNDTHNRNISNLVFRCGVVSLTIDVKRNEITDVKLENGAHKV